MRQKSTCDRCRALTQLAGAAPACQLGHKIDPATIRPLEACEKPLTNMALILACEDRANKNWMKPRTPKVFVAAPHG